MKRHPQRLVEEKNNEKLVCGRAKWKTTSTLKGNGRRPKFVGKWKTTSISRYMEDDLILLANRRSLQFVGRRPQCFFNGRCIFK